MSRHVIIPAPSGEGYHLRLILRREEAIGAGLSRFNYPGFVHRSPEDSPAHFRRAFEHLERALADRIAQRADTCPEVPAWLRVARGRFVVSTPVPEHVRDQFDGWRYIRTAVPDPRLKQALKQGEEIRAEHLERVAIAEAAANSGDF